MLKAQLRDVVAKSIDEATRFVFPSAPTGFTLTPAINRAKWIANLAAKAAALQWIDSLPDDYSSEARFPDQELKPLATSWLNNADFNDAKVGEYHLGGGTVETANRFEVTLEDGRSISGVVNGLSLTIHDYCGISVEATVAKGNLLKACAAAFSDRFPHWSAAA